LSVKEAILQAREEADEELTQALNHYTAALQVCFSRFEAFRNFWLQTCRMLSRLCPEVNDLVITSLIHSDRAKCRLVVIAHMLGRSVKSCQRMMDLLVLLTITLLGLIAINNALPVLGPPTEVKDRLSGVVMLARHGTRAPDSRFGRLCPAANGTQSEFERLGFSPGQLTPQGILQLYAVGEFVRLRYIETEFLPKQFCHADIAVSAA